MEKEFVPYNLSLRLKQLGFNEPCMRGWDKDGKIWYHPDSDIILDNPTYSQAFRWFRENYDLEYAILPESGSRLKLKERVYNVCVFRFIMNLNVQPEILRKGRTILRYMNRDNAELACLEKLIEIVELK